MQNLIYFLDDDINRTEGFLSLFKDKKNVIVKCFETAESIIEELKKGEKIFALFLDHDLGGEVYVDSDREDCGMEVARFLSQSEIHSRDSIGLIVIHSWNIPAANRMFQLLRDSLYNVTYKPFSVKDFSKFL